VNTTFHPPNPADRLVWHNGSDVYPWTAVHDGADFRNLDFALFVAGRRVRRPS
jgi:hypothetical protein